MSILSPSGPSGAHAKLLPPGGQRDRMLAYAGDQGPAGQWAAARGSRHVAVYVFHDRFSPAQARVRCWPDIAAEPFDPTIAARSQG